MNCTLVIAVFWHPKDGSDKTTRFVEITSENGNTFTVFTRNVMPPFYVDSYGELKQRVNFAKTTNSDTHLC